MSTSNSDLFDVVSWDAVTVWSWDLSVDSCAVCRNHIMSRCIECQANEGKDGRTDCTVAWGECNHAFHFHCISRWLLVRNSCPLDNSVWTYAKYGK